MILLHALFFFSQSLDTRLTDILPNLQFSTKERTEYGNILDLLTHGMGMPRHNMLRLHPSLTRKDIIKYERFSNK